MAIIENIVIEKNNFIKFDLSPIKKLIIIIVQTQNDKI